MLYQLYLKSDNSSEYSSSEYSKQCNLYKNAVDKCKSIGSRLNELYQELFGLNNKPNGTFQYRDKEGKLKHGWIPPDILDNVLKSVEAKRGYRVLIKDPMNGHIQEDFWELTVDEVEKFVDENDTAYCAIAYEKGEKYYMFVVKEIWDSIPGYAGYKG